MTTDDFHRILDHVELHERDDDRMAAKSGLALYVHEGDLTAVDDKDNVGLPVEKVRRTPVDVTSISNPVQGMTAYNDGSTGTEGPAHYDGTDWISTVDGTTIA